MIIQKTITLDDGSPALYTYSNIGMLICQNETGALYDEAIDSIESGYTYTETDIPGGDDDMTTEELYSILIDGIEWEPKNEEEPSE